MVWLLILAALVVKGLAFFVAARRFSSNNPAAEQQDRLQQQQLAAIEYSVVRQGERREGVSTVLVAGGCSALGSRVVEQLLETPSDGERVNVVVLDSRAALPGQHITLAEDDSRGAGDAATVSGAAAVRHPGVTYIKGNVFNTSHARLAIVSTGCTGIVLVAQGAVDGSGECPFGGGSKAQQAQQAQHATDVRKLVELVLEKDAVKFIVYSSSVVVPAPAGLVQPSPAAAVPAEAFRSLPQAPQQPPAQEQQPHRGCSGACRTAAESLLLTVNSHVLKTVVLRPGVIIDASMREELELVPHRVLDGPIIGSGSARVCTVDVHDAAAALVLATRRLMAVERRRQRHAQPHQATTQAGNVAEASGDAPLARIDGKVLRLCCDCCRAASVGSSKGDAGAASNGAGGSTDVHCTYRQLLPAWQRRVPWSLPSWLAQALAWLNGLFAALGAGAVLGTGLTTARVRLLCRDMQPCCDSTAACELLGWQPRSWQQATGRRGSALYDETGGRADTGETKKEA